LGRGSVLGADVLSVSRETRLSPPGLPASAAWRHHGPRDGIETVFFAADDTGHRLEGHVVAVEDGLPWAVRYEISVDQQWMTRSARVVGRSSTGTSEALLESDGDGHWRVNGERRPGLDGCTDVDLEASMCTNTIPVQRLGLRIGEAADVPAAYVRVADAGVERLEQRYIRLAGEGDGCRHYQYRSPSFDFESRLLYDESGLILDYPGIGRRILS